MDCQYSYTREILKFLKTKHNIILGKYIFSDDIVLDSNAQNLDEPKLCIYSCNNENEKIMLVCKGKDRGKVIYWIDGNMEVLFHKLVEFAKYLELCERRNISENVIFDLVKSQIYRNMNDKNKNSINNTQIKNIMNVKNENTFDDLIDKQSIEPNLELENEIYKKIDNKLQGFIREEDMITLTEFDFEQMILPDKIVIENQIIEKADINLKTIQIVQQHLYDGDYERIELTYFGYMIYKKKKYLSHENSLVFLCEDGKSIMCYFNGEKLNISIFFANRDDAGSLPSELIPSVMFRGREESEQHILYDRSILVKILLELLNTGNVNCEVSFRTIRNGYFSTRYFSNKNAYLKNKNQIGEF